MSSPEEGQPQESVTTEPDVAEPAQEDTTSDGPRAVPAPVESTNSTSADDDDFISEAKLRKMARSDVISLATDAGLDHNELLGMETNKIVDKLLAEFGVE